MSEYWKSLPKYYCDFCKCWITDNKASRDFHERGFRHQGNVKKRVRDIQKNSTLQEKERQEYDSVIAKIEASALNSFQNDIVRDPSLSKEVSHITPREKAESIASSHQDKGASFNRFGQSFRENESETLVNGKKRALETIAKAFEKKSKWLEAKTAEGTTYYWNKDTLETKYEAPKSGFLSIEEQNQFKSASSSSSADAAGFTHAQLSNQYLRGGWKAVEQSEELDTIDLQLPTQDVSQIMLDFKQGSNKDSKEVTEEKPAFKEKTVDTLKRPFSAAKDDAVSFKKRSAVRRNIRSREPDD